MAGQLDCPETDITVSWVREALERPGSFLLWGTHPRSEDMFVDWSLGPVIEHRDSEVLDRANARALKRELSSDPSLEDDWMITGCSHWAVGHVDHLSFRVLEPETEDQARRRERLEALLERMDERAYQLALRKAPYLRKMREVAWERGIQLTYGKENEEALNLLPYREASEYLATCDENTDNIDRVRAFARALEAILLSRVTRIARFLWGWFKDLEDYVIADEDLYSQMEYDEQCELAEQEIPDLLGEDAPEGALDEVVAYLFDEGSFIDTLPDLDEAQAFIESRGWGP